MFQNAQPVSADTACDPSRSELKEEILRRIETFPVTAFAAWELHRYLQSAERSLSGAAELVASDSDLLEAAQGAAASSSNRPLAAISTDEALQAIGLERLGRVALREWLRSVSPRSLPVYGVEGSRFFRRSLACAAAMRLLHHGCVDEVESAYAIGLLHELGKIVIDAVVKEKGASSRRLTAATPRMLAQMEREALGIDHARVAGLALRRWGFSPDVYVPISEQFCALPNQDFFEWTQSLVISRFVAERVLEAESGKRDVLRGEGSVEFRKRSLSEIFEYSLACSDPENLRCGC